RGPYELDAAQRRLVIEQDPRGRMHAEALAVVDGDPVRIQLRNAIRAAWIERRLLALPRCLRLTEHLARRRLVEPRRRSALADSFEHVDGAKRIDVGRMNRLVPRRTDEALRGKIVDLVGRIAGEYAEHGAHVGDVT